MEQNRKVLDALTGRNSVLNAMEQNRKLLKSISGRTSFASMIGVNSTLSAISSQPGFGAMIGTAVMPRPAWQGIFDGLRGPIGTDLYEDTRAEFDAAAILAGEGEGETWWIARLPFVAQVALLLVVLQALDAAGEFMSDMTGADVPPAYRSATTVLFALAATLLAFIEAKAKAAADSGSDEPEDREV